MYTAENFIFSLLISVYFALIKIEYADLELLALETDSLLTNTTIVGVHDGNFIDHISRLM